MIIRCTDLETTGIPSEVDPHAVIEIGWCDLDFNEDGGAIGEPYSVLVNPGRAIPVEATAINHIRDKDVAGAPLAAGVFASLMVGADVFCSHHSDFEQKFFGGGDKPWVCTFKTALRVWLDAPGHSNQVLRYWLGLDDRPDFDPALAMPPHRAAPDAYVTAHILRELLGQCSLGDMMRWSKGPALLHMCFLKKHKGTPWSQVPADYLSWIVEKSDITDRNIRATAKYYLRQKAAASAARSEEVA